MHMPHTYPATNPSPTEPARRHSRKGRRWHGIPVKMITVLLLVLLLGLNGVVSGLSQRYLLQADVTVDGAFTLSAESKAYLHSLKQSVTITVLDSEQTFVNQGNYSAYYRIVNELLRRYQLQSSFVKLQYIDLNQRPIFGCL